MQGLIATIHHLERGERFPSYVDLTAPKVDGTGTGLAGTIFIDLLSDLGLDAKAFNRIQRGESVHIRLIEEEDTRQ